MRSNSVWTTGLVCSMHNLSEGMSKGLSGVAGTTELDGTRHMKGVWVTRSFLDYRIPVYEEVSRRFDDHFALIFNADYVPDRCCRKAEEALGRRARGLRHELAFQSASQNTFANKSLRIPYQRGLVKVILKEKPDVLISDGFFGWTYSALWLRATRFIPHVMCYERTAHTERNAQWYRTAYRKLVMRWIDAICCSGRLCGEYVKSLGYPEDCISYGHMAADVDGLRLAVSSVSEKRVAELAAEFSLKGIVFLFVGRLILLKGIRELLRAWELFSSGVAPDQATLLLVGDGPQRVELGTFCAENRLKNVRFAGSVDYGELAPYYKAADVFVIPTLEDNWSLVVPEAMACRLPILCSEFNGCWPELVKRENGWVFNPLDVESTADVLRECLDAQRHLSEMGQVSARVVQHHTATQAAEVIFMACQSAVKHRRVM